MKDILFLKANLHEYICMTTLVFIKFFVLLLRLTFSYCMLQYSSNISFHSKTSYINCLERKILRFIVAKH